MALRFADYGYILENGRVVMDGAAGDLAQNEDVKEFYVGLSTGATKVVPRCEALPAQEAAPARVVMNGRGDAPE